MKYFLAIKNLIYGLALICIGSVANAQDKQIEAIASYQLAEEYFNSTNFLKALNHIEAAKSTLGIANSKILYLEIQILSELGKTDSKYLQKALESIKGFEKAPDLKQFSQEKRVEIAKMKIWINQTFIEMESERKEKAEIEAKRDQAVSTFFTKYPRLGMPIEEFLRHPATANFAAFYGRKNWKHPFSHGEGVLYVRDEFYSYVSGISTNEQGIVKAYVITTEVNDISDVRSLVYHMGLDESYSELLRPTIAKKWGVGEEFEAWELSSDTGYNPSIFIHMALRTTNYKMNKPGKKWSYVRYVITHVYDK